MLKKDEMPRKFCWHASSSSGGTLSLDVVIPESKGRNEKIRCLAEALRGATEEMRKMGYIPYEAVPMSSRDIANKYQKTRQYWEKLLNEGKILYKETSAGRITTDLWVEGYLDNPEKVNKYVKHVRTVLGSIKNAGKKFGSVPCPVCDENRFEFAVNAGSNTNGVCRSCGFHINATQ